MATVLKGAGARYDVRPARADGSFYGGPLTGFACMLKDAMQGAGAGFLSLTGATSIASGQPMTAAGDLGMLGAVFPSLAASSLTGPLQVVGGIILFLAARRTISRTAGLMGFLGFLAAYANGYSLADMLSVASDVLKTAASLLEPVQAGTV